MLQRYHKQRVACLPRREKSENKEKLRFWGSLFHKKGRNSSSMARSLLSSIFSFSSTSLDPQYLLRYMAPSFMPINVNRKNINHGVQPFRRSNIHHQVLPTSSIMSAVTTRSQDPAKISHAESSLLSAKKIRIVSIAYRRCGKNGFVCVVDPTREASKNGAPVKTRNTRADAKMRCGRCVCANTECSCKYLSRLFPRLSSACKRAKG